MKEGENDEKVMMKNGEGSKRIIENGK